MKHGAPLLVSIYLFCAVHTAFAQTTATPAASPNATASPNITTTPTPVVSPSSPEEEKETTSPAANPTPASSTPAAATTNAIGAVRSGTIVLPTEKAQPVRIPRFDAQPTIDGRLDDEVWKRAVILKDFYQTQPGDNSPPSYPMEVMIGYDAKFLYVAFHAYDEPGKVRATVARRDGVFDEDNVRIYLDTFNDQRRAYVFGFNPLGVQQDGIHTESSGTDFSVDIVMESKGTLTDDGYIVEVAIPFKSLRYEAGKGKLWGIHLWRNIDRLNDEIDSWMPLARNNSGLLNQAGHITGLEGIDTERTIEIIPSLTLSETGRYVRAQPPTPFPGMANVAPGRLVNQPIEFDPGLTAKFGLTPTITFDFAYNPDFAQVEADQTVVTANQRFPIFFEEKRPFFLEGQDIFQTRMNIVNTRAIIDPDYAAKLTGRRGRNTFGLLLASDNAPGNYSEDERGDLRDCQERRLADPTVRCGIERFLDKNAYIGVLRLKRDVGRESNVGLFATTYNFIERHNNLGGFDGRFRLDPQTVFEFQVLGTNTRRFFFDPARDENLYRTGNGLGYSYFYDKTWRNFGYTINGVGRTRDYRADVGFTPRTNTNQHRAFFRYSTDPNAKSKLVFYRLTSQTIVSHDWQGRSQDWESEFQAMFALQRQTYVGGGFEPGYTRLFEEEFGRLRTPSRTGAFFGDAERSTYRTTAYGFIETSPSKKYGADVVVIYTWNAFDFDFGAGRRFPRVSPAALANPNNSNVPLDPGKGNALRIEASLEYRPTDAIRTSLDYIKSRLVRNDTGRVAFDDNIFTFRATYQFTRFTFARARIDYSTLSTRVRPQLLLGYTPNPGTAFYVGYNDDLSRNGFNPFNNQLEPGFRRNGRTFFIKMSYLFQRSF